MVAGAILRARAFLLYHYLPYDKSLWGRLRSPPSLALQLIASWPELAVRATFFAVLLLCLLYDLEENQLMKFVLALKSTQFLTGLYFALSGYFLFWRCDVFYQPGVCDSAGPGVGHSPVRDFMSIVGLQAMVYLAILLLPYSVQCGELRETQVLDAKASADAAAAAAAAAKAAAADAADAAAADAAADGAAADGAATADAEPHSPPRTTSVFSARRSPSLTEAAPTTPTRAASVASPTTSRAPTPARAASVAAEPGAKAGGRGYVRLADMDAATLDAARRRRWR